MAEQLGVYALDSLSAEELERIDEICETFEASCVRGQPIPLEQLLDGVEERLKGSLLCELIKLEIDYRRRSNLNPIHEEYTERFPEGKDAVQAAFASTDSCSVGFSSLQFPVDYEIGELLARGGLGEIYIGYDNKLERRVAIKIPRNRDSESVERKRLQQEAKITGQLDHPNIVPVYASRLSNDDWPCYTMQLIEGKTLRDEVIPFHAATEPQKRYDNFEFRRLLRSLISVCNAVAYAHTQSVIHRDIKPGNIMLGSFGETFLIDWGLAKKLRTPDAETKDRIETLPESESWKGSRDDTAPTIAGQPIGTPEFASPEQMAGRTNQQDYRTDVYSLGATLYFLLTGVKPNTVAATDGLSNVSPVLKPSIPRDVAAICAKAMAFEREGRYQTVSQLADDLERYLADEPISVLHSSTMTKLRRWSNKNPRWLSGALTGILVAIVAATIGAFLLGQKNSDLRYANSSLIKTNQKLSNSRQKTANVLHAVTDQTMQKYLGQKAILTDEDHLFLNQLLEQYFSFAETVDDDGSAIELKLEANLRISQILHLLGRSQDALATLQRSLKLVQDFDGKMAQRIRAFEAQAMVKSGELLLRLGKRSDGRNRLLESKQRLNQIRTELDPEDYLFHHAKCSATLGIVYFESGELAKSMEHYEQTIELYDRLLENDLDNDHFLHDLAGVYTNLGIAFFESGQNDQAAEKFNLAMELNDRLANQGNTNMGFQLERVKTLLAIANLQRKQKSPDAKQSYMKVIEECSHLTHKYPGVPVNFVTLARAHQFLGQMQMYQSDREESLKHTRQAVLAAKKAVALEPYLEKYQYTLFTSQMSLAVVLRLTKAYDDADETYTQCIEIGESMLRRFGSVKHRVGLARAHYAFAVLKNSQSQKQEAKVQLNRAKQIMEQGTSTDQRNSVFRSLMANIENELSKLDQDR